MSLEHGKRREESQFSMSTFLLFKLDIRSKKTLWYSTLLLTMTGFGSKFEINFSRSHFFVIFKIKMAAIISSISYYCPFTLTMCISRNHFLPLHES
jgi:hypothetical protein